MTIMGFTESKKARWSIKHQKNLDKDTILAQSDLQQAAMPEVAEPCAPPLDERREVLIFLKLHECHEDMTETETLGMMRLKDPNEAAGLALRLLAGETPFRDMPMGMSGGIMLSAIDRNHYVFARRANKAVGFACWAFTAPQGAEDWMRKGIPFESFETATPGAAVVVLAVQAIDTETARFLIKGLRDNQLAAMDLCYYVRDYGKNGKTPRYVRLIRPKVRRLPRS